MESLSKAFSETLKTVNLNEILKLIVSLIVIYIIYVNFIRREKFSDDYMDTLTETKTDKIEQYNSPVNSKSLEMDQRSREIKMDPPNLNPDTRSVMAGDGFIPQKDTIPAWGGNNYGLVDDLDDGAGGNMGLHYNLCSPSCCSAQYPTPHKLAKDPLVCGREDEFVPSSITCQNSWQNSGCACLTKKQASFMSNRGGNAA
jgi:hypothetical protein